MSRSQQQKDDDNDEFFPGIVFVVSTCVMGNLVGGYMAKLMGVPIGVVNCGIQITWVTCNKCNHTAVLLAMASPCKFQHAMTSALGEEAWQAY
ncbi:hypothetical protein ACA910_009835 [Epithemia clementina (nom. ined.)]